MLRTAFSKKSTMPDGLGAIADIAVMGGGTLNASGLKLTRAPESRS